MVNRYNAQRKRDIWILQGYLDIKMILRYWGVLSQYHFNIQISSQYPQYLNIPIPFQYRLFQLFIHILSKFRQKVLNLHLDIFFIPPQYLADFLRKKLRVKAKKKGGRLLHKSQTTCPQSFHKDLCLLTKVRENFMLSVSENFSNFVETKY